MGTALEHGLLLSDSLGVTATSSPCSVAPNDLCATSSRARSVDEKFARCVGMNSVCAGGTGGTPESAGQLAASVCSSVGDSSEPTAVGSATDELSSKVKQPMEFVPVPAPVRRISVRTISGAPQRGIAPRATDAALFN